MIAKLFNLLLDRSASIRPPHGFQKRFEWQSEFLFVAAKPPLRYDAIPRARPRGKLVKFPIFSLPFENRCDSQHIGGEQIFFMVGSP